MAELNITKLKDCAIATRNYTVYGFSVRKGMIYGLDPTSRRIYATWGAVRAGAMRVYLSRDNGFTDEPTLFDRTSPIFQMIQSRYGDIIKERNKAYKDSAKALADLTLWKTKRYGQELRIKPRSGQNKISPDARHRARTTSIKERRQGINDYSKEYTWYPRADYEGVK